MPWNNPELDLTVKKAKKLIKKYFPKSPLTAPILVANKRELMNGIVLEGEELRLSKTQILERKILSKYVQGKYFKKSNTIWLLEGKGENLNTIIHELLHSIQNCDPNRENIVEYITYKLTGEENGLNQSFINEWTGIEQKIGMQKISQQLLKEKDCEVFE